MTDPKAILFRDPDHGALAILETDDGALVTIDHGFNMPEFEIALGLLERHSRGYKHAPCGASEQGARWDLTSPRFSVLASLRERMAREGYSDDPLGERAVIEVDRLTAMHPDLPGRGKCRPRERVERVLRRHLDLALSALRDRGDVALGEVAVLPRSATGRLGRPLPFLRARAVLRRPVEGPQEVREAVRDALRGMGDAVTQASVIEADRGVYAVTIGLAPSRSACESYVREALPTFEDGAVLGTRVVRFLLQGILPVEERQQLESRATACTAATGLARPRGRCVVVRIPATVQGDPITDYPFQQRLAWLHQQLEAYGPQLEHVSDVEPILTRDAPQGPASIGETDSVTEARAVTVSSKDPATMTPAQITKEQAKLREMSSKVGAALIDAGRGHERASETRQAAGTGDPLAKDYVTIADRQEALLQEIKFRTGSRHGTLTRIHKKRR